MLFNLHLHIERWKKYPRCSKSKILISTDGRVKIDGKIAEPKILLDSGYFVVKVNDKYELIHRLVAETWIRSLKGGDTIDHVDSNKRNNSLKNLEIISHEENLARADKKLISKNGITAAEWKAQRQKEKTPSEDKWPERIVAASASKWLEKYNVKAHHSETVLATMRDNLKKRAKANKAYLGYQLSFDGANIIGVKMASLKD